MNFERMKAYVLLGIEVSKLNRAAIHQLARDPGALAPAFLIVAIGGLLSGLGHLSLVGILLYPLLSLIMFFLNVAVLHGMAALMFKGRGSFNQLAQVLGTAYVLTWVSVVPLLGAILALLASLWILVIDVVIVQEVYGLVRIKAVMTVVIPMLAILLFMVLFGGMWGPRWGAI